MKRILLICLVSTMFVGCASTQQTNQGNADSARKSCISAGFKPGTDLFFNCFTAVLDKQSQPSFIQQYMLNLAASPKAYYNDSTPNYGPESTTCFGTGSTRTCSTTGGASNIPRTTKCNGTGSIRTCTTN